MSLPDFVETALLSGAVMADGADTVRNGVILHFGQPQEELAAAESTAVVCPVSDLIRLRATGKDRARFLHNFCTNNIVDLPQGHLCEAFFTDVKARVIAHGWLLALPESHEIWMLPGDPEALLKHLNRYIITEDVTFEQIPDQTTFAVIGPQSASVLSTAGLESPGLSQVSVNSSDTLVVSTNWAGQPVFCVSVPSDQAAHVWQQLIESRATATGRSVFEHLRILERFPRVGVDLTADHMAPQADRNATAISYTKGCYLGQEPIARLDAMGHVNRQLYRGIAKNSDHTVPAGDAAAVTSVSSLMSDHRPVLAMLNVKDAQASQDIPATLPDGQSVKLTLVPDA